MAGPKVVDKGGKEGEEHAGQGKPCRRLLVYSGGARPRAFIKGHGWADREKKLGLGENRKIRAASARMLNSSGLGHGEDITIEKLRALAAGVKGLKYGKEIMEHSIFEIETDEGMPGTGRYVRWLMDNASDITSPDIMDAWMEANRMERMERPAKWKKARCDTLKRLLKELVEDADTPPEALAGIECYLAKWFRTE